jgi:hypothetical protein
MSISSSSMEGGTSRFGLQPQSIFGNVTHDLASLPPIFC